MKAKISLLVALLCFMIVPVNAQAPDEPVKHKLRFTAGQIDRFKTSMKMQMAMAIPNMPASDGAVPAMNMSMNMTMVTRQKTLGILPDGSAKVSHTYEAVDVDMPGLAANDKKNALAEVQKQLKQMPPITVIVNKYGQVTGIDGMPSIPGLPKGADFSSMISGIGGLGNITYAFPDEAVSVGDMWTQDIPIMGAGKLTVNSTLNSLNTLLNKRVVSKINQDFKGHIEMGDLMKTMLSAFGANSSSSQMPTIDGQIDMSGWGVTYFDVAKGQMVRSDADIDVVLNIRAAAAPGQSAGAGQSMNISMTMKIVANTMSLAK